MPVPGLPRCLTRERETRLDGKGGATFFDESKSSTPVDIQVPVEGGFRAFSGGDAVPLVLPWPCEGEEPVAGRQICAKAGARSGAHFVQPMARA